MGGVFDDISLLYFYCYSSAQIMACSVGYFAFRRFLVSFDGNKINSHVPVAQKSADKLLGMSNLSLLNPRQMSHSVGLPS